MTLIVVSALPMHTQASSQCLLPWQAATNSAMVHVNIICVHSSTLAVLSVE